MRRVLEHSTVLRTGCDPLAASTRMVHRLLLAEAGLVERVGP